MTAIEVANLRYGYTKSETTLDGIDLRLAKGEAHAILGGSGAGKTTLLNLLSGLLRADAGTIRFDGRDVTGLGGAARNVAQVFQFPVLYPSLSVADNIGFALRNHGWPGEAVRKRVDEVAELLEIAPLATKRPRALSLFEKQLVAIARALARPDVALVLLDEPLTAVEPATKWRLRRTLKTIQRELGLTMVYVTHDQAEALTFADRITLLHRGGVLQTGTPLELYEAPAHTEVARFIGSPGMNLVAAEAREGGLWVGERMVAAGEFKAGCYKIGFRPEWATIEAHVDSDVGALAEGDALRDLDNGYPRHVDGDAGPLVEGIPVVIETVRVLGTEEGAPLGLVTARLGDRTIHVRQRLHGVGHGFGAESAGSFAPTNENSSRAQLSGLANTAVVRVETERLTVFRNNRLVPRMPARAASHRAVDD